MNFFGGLYLLTLLTVTVALFTVAIKDLVRNSLQSANRLTSASFVVGNVELENLALSCGVLIVLEGIR